MKKLTTLVAFLVTWKVTGLMMYQCSDPKQMDPVSALCFQNANFTRSSSFDKKDEAEDWIKKLQGTHMPYNIDDIHMYAESAVTKAKPVPNPWPTKRDAPPVDKK